jgi:predicted O-linked N-acetylglucosamine transferase (SPINDLY family)
MSEPSMKHYARSRAWCEWDGFEQWPLRAGQALADPLAAPLPPFHLLSLPGIDAAQQRQACERWMAGRLQASAPARAAFAAEPSPAAAGDGRLRVAYLSNDFHDHATAHLLVEMLEAHDRLGFELHAYSYGDDDGHGMRQRLQAPFARFTDIRGRGDGEVARTIRDAGIQILVDLKGYTAGTRTELLSWRAAPLQVNYLGYPGTLGGAWCDYLLGDAFVTPLADAADYSEALALMPHSYQPHGRSTTLGAPPARAAQGLPGQGLVLCNFNQAWKFTPEVFDVWCRVLDAVPDSVLWLLHDDQAQGNLRREALARGINPGRLVFAPHRPQAEHLARLACADLVLDTLPYNAHTTASDALCAGVPLLTCTGPTFASRVAGSLLHAVGLPELVTADLAHYEQQALALATQPALLLALRERLAQQRPQAPLFDVARYTRDLEALYQAMWQRHAAGLRPQLLQLTR